jgi:hypothetical protein
MMTDDVKFSDSNLPDFRVDASRGAMRAALQNARRWGAVGAFRLASRLLRRATLPHRQHRISHNGLRTVLSGTRLPERFGAVLVLGRQRKDQDIQSEHAIDPARAALSLELSCN